MVDEPLDPQRPITPTEMIELFGEAFPKEAYMIAATAPDGTTIGEIRALVREAGEAKQTAATEWQWVPIVPTAEMLTAGIAAVGTTAMYTAMLAAAPQPYATRRAFLERPQVGEQA